MQRGGLLLLGFVVACSAAPAPGDFPQEGGDAAESSSEGSDSSGEPATSPYAGGWDVGDCQAAVVAGDGVATDLVAFDQYGEAVRLWDFCHKAVLLPALSFT